MEPQVEWWEKTGSNCLRFTFGEKFTEREADLAIIKWKEAFQQRKNQCVSLVWDCRDMKRYERAARRKWTTALHEMRPRIGAIWLISDSPLVRFCASVMRMATSLNIKVVRSEKEVTL